MFTKKFQTGHIRKIFIANIADPRKFIYAKYFNISDGFIRESFCPRKFVRLK